MRVKIEHECVDKHTGERYEKGQKLNVKKERAAELIEAGHKQIPPRKPRKAPKNKMAGGSPEDKG